MTDRQSAETMTKLGIKRTPFNRAIRMKCGECMGGEPGKMPLGETARWIDACSSTHCSLWPFRYGRDPWRAPVSEAQREAQREASQRNGKRAAALRHGKPEKAAPIDA